MPKTNYWKKYNDLKAEVCGKIITELGRIGKDFKSKNEELEFLGFESVVDAEIEVIESNGSIQRSKDREFEDTSFYTLIVDDIISLDDCICLLDELRNYKTTK